jgi:hypothetical protein
VARQGKAWLGKSRLVMEWLFKAKQSKARQGKASIGMARQGVARQ